LNNEEPEINDRVVEDVSGAKTRDVKKSVTNAQQESEVLTENGVSGMKNNTLIESRFQISHYAKSRFWAVYDDDALVVVAVYRRGAEEVRRRLQVAADLEL
jgi:hypothetical protein